MSAMQWSTLERAINAWVRAGSGLGQGAVIWSAQNGPAPQSPYIEISMSSIRTVGNDWIDVEDGPPALGFAFPGFSDDAFSASGAQGVYARVRGLRRVNLTLQCFANASTGALGAAAILTDVIASAGLPSRSEALAQAGVGISTITDVRAIGGVVNSTRFEPRAIVDVVFYASSELVEEASYIEFVEIEGSLADGTEAFELDGFADSGFQTEQVVTLQIP